MKIFHEGLFTACGIITAEYVWIFLKKEDNRDLRKRSHQGAGPTFILSVLQMVTKNPGMNVNPWIAWFRFDFLVPQEAILLPLHWNLPAKKQRMLMIPGLTVTMKPTFNIFEPYEAVAVEYCVIF